MSAPKDGPTTWCQAWIIRRGDGMVLGLTDHDRQLAVDGIACEPETGFDPSAAEASLGLSGDTGEVAGIIASGRITADDVARGAYDEARIEQWLVDWKNPAGASCIRRYHAGEISIEDEVVRLELRSLSAALDRPRGRHFSRACDAEVGDARCAHPLAGLPWRMTGTVGEIHGPQALAVAVPAVPPAPDWFDHGILEAGSSRWPVVTARPVPDSPAMWRVLVAVSVTDLPQPGTPVTLVAGCDKAFTTCRAKFANSINFRGFPHMPGDDRALRYASGPGEYDGGPLVP